MLKNTVTGSLLAKILPATVAKHFLENASQDDVNKAEQEAAVLHQQMQGNLGTPPPPAAPVAEAVATPPVATASATVPPATVATAAPVAVVPTAADLTAMTTRATTAESQVQTLQGQLASAQAEASKYKAWHDKHATTATALPNTDAANRDQANDRSHLSTASAAGLDQFLKSRGGK